MKKCMIVVVLSVVMLMSLASPALAVSRSVTLYPSQTSVTSGHIGASKYGKQTTTDDSSSLFSVYGMLCYATTSGGTYSTASQCLVARGTVGSTSSTKTTAGYWKVELNPYGWYTSGCRAYGTVQY